MYRERFYRDLVAQDRFRSIRVEVGESDLWIAFSADDDGPSEKEVIVETERTIRAERESISAWAAAHRGFLTSFEPCPFDESSPPVVAAMLRAGLAASVGPMAAVAGAIAERVGRSLKECFSLGEIVVENGGDLWLSVKKPLLVAVYAGLSSLSGRVGIELPSELTPCGVATSSGTVGPSVSFGKADAALVVAADAAVADAWATALGNRCRNWESAEEAVRTFVGPHRPEALGGLVVMGDRLSASGAIRLAPLKKGAIRP